MNVLETRAPNTNGWSPVIPAAAAATAGADLSDQDERRAISQVGTRQQCVSMINYLRRFSHQNALWMTDFELIRRAIATFATRSGTRDLWLNARQIAAHWRYMVALIAESFLR